MTSVRESLFNWLQPGLRDSHCLDMFAGSGALGLEALSRGAKHCTFLDQAARGDYSHSKPPRDAQGDG